MIINIKLTPKYRKPIIVVSVAKSRTFRALAVLFVPDNWNAEFLHFDS